MKQISKGAYLSPQTEVLGLRFEGVLCASAETEYRETSNEVYSSEGLYEIF